MTRQYVELSLRHLTPQEREVLLTKAAIYAHRYADKIYGGGRRFPETGGDILNEAFSRAIAEWRGYTFKDGDIVFYLFLCRCCRKVVLSLQRRYGQDRNRVNACTHIEPEAAEDDETPADLTENDAVAFLERRASVDEFLVFVARKRLRAGKQRAYCAGLVAFAQEGLDTSDIAARLSVTTNTVRTYRSRLRELVEEFTIERERHNTVKPPNGSRPSKCAGPGKSGKKD